MKNISPGFVGRITNSAESRNAALQVKLYAGEEVLEIVSMAGEEWSWDMSDVTMSRVAIDRFLLQLADEQLYFLPVDPLGFISKVVEKYSDEPLEPHRGWLRRRIEAAQATGGDDSGYDIGDIFEIDDTDVSKAGRRKHEHEWQEGSAVGVVTRRCVSCGHVSIDATGVTSALEDELASV